MHYYQVSLLKDPANPGPVAMLAHLRDRLASPGGVAGAQVFGMFQGLFGLASNELYVVVHGESPGLDVSAAAGDYRVVATTNLVPTVRPTEHRRCEREGVYVFRWFTVRNRDVDEIARLSEVAWQTFESGFDTEVQGLFREPHRDHELGRMLLITWYADLNAWQASRQPPPAARENFMRRHALTLEAFPVATRLVSAGMAPVVPGGENRF